MQYLLVEMWHPVSSLVPWGCTATCLPLFSVSASEIYKRFSTYRHDTDKSDTIVVRHRPARNAFIYATRFPLTNLRMNLLLSIRRYRPWKNSDVEPLTFFSKFTDFRHFQRFGVFLKGNQRGGDFNLIIVHIQIYLLYMMAI